MEHSEPAPTEESTTLANALIDALDAVLSCSRSVVELAVATFIAGGHLLLEDVPGVGKTTLARALGTAIGGDTRRIQFTPDMLPGDLTGVSVYNQRTGSFDFHPGPLFANIVIADEVNRANPKAQSAMLEAMGEGQVSADGRTWPLPDPFFVVATQNPIELEGTYPLPEAQLDRFMACTGFGYPTAEAECAMLTSPDRIARSRCVRCMRSAPSNRPRPCARPWRRSCSRPRWRGTSWTSYPPHARIPASGTALRPAPDCIWPPWPGRRR